MVFETPSCCAETSAIYKNILHILKVSLWTCNIFFSQPKPFINHKVMCFFVLSEKMQNTPQKVVFGYFVFFTQNEKTHSFLAYQQFWLRDKYIECLDMQKCLIYCRNFCTKLEVSKTTFYGFAANFHINFWHMQKFLANTFASRKGPYMG